MKKKTIPVKINNPYDIIREGKGRDGKNAIYLGRELITDPEKRTLVAEAKALVSMRLWSVLNESIKQLCYERGWRDSKTIEELNIAKAMYSVLDTQQSIVDKIIRMV